MQTVEEGYGGSMKRLPLLLPLFLAAASVNAQVDPDIHKLCSSVTDYAGCVQTQMSLSSSVKKKLKPVSGGNCLSPDLSNAEYIKCIEEVQALTSNTYEQNQPKRGGSYGQNQSTSSRSYSSNGCPPGKRPFRKTALFGLIKGKKICLSDYEAESLRAQRQRDIQNSIQQSQPKIINCTSNRFGSYMSTTCF